MKLTGLVLLCIERGGVYLNKTGGCLERDAE